MQNANAIGCGRFISEAAILEGSEIVNIAVLADVFAKHSNFAPSYAPPADPLLRWLNSVGVVHVENHLTDLADGVGWARIVDRVIPGSVDWKKVNIVNVNNIKKRSNCEYMANLIKEKFQLKMSLTQEDLFTGVDDRINPAIEEMIKFDVKTHGYHA